MKKEELKEIIKEVIAETNYTFQLSQLNKIRKIITSLKTMVKNNEISEGELEKVIKQLKDINLNKVEL
jgi:hypothetical protein